MPKNRKDVIRNLVTIILLRASQDEYKEVQFRYKKGDEFVMCLVTPDNEIGLCEQLQMEDFEHVRAVIEEFAGDCYAVCSFDGVGKGKIENIGDGVIVDWPVEISWLDDNSKVHISIKLIGER